MIKKKYIIKYSFEFIVIVLGISVSFWLNELSIENQNEGERIKVLNSLKMEINEIKDYTYEREKTWATDLRLLNELLLPRNGVIDTDSILKITTAKSRIETFLVIYRVFDPPMNRYFSIINSGDLKFVKSDKIKEILSRLHNTSFSYVETTVEYEKQLKQSFLPFISENHPDIILARDDNSVSMKKYIDIIGQSINKDKKLKANFIMVKRYLDYKLSFLRLYVMSLEDLEREINLVLD
ncbi:MAG: hypothetical protein CL869_03535 [Cytophagia bacterium]|nr:hypothetical protein [Cytophagia bacterium]|tara:strand:- start:2158 stop:2871 length:714 start_codon:yes stop_codon:yes gene_type:complete